MQRAETRRVLFEKLMVIQLVRIFLTFYRTLMYISVFTKERSWSLCRASRVKSAVLHPNYLGQVLILTSTSHLFHSKQVPSVRCAQISLKLYTVIFAISEHATADLLSKSNDATITKRTHNVTFSFLLCSLFLIIIAFFFHTVFSGTAVCSCLYST